MTLQCTTRLPLRPAAAVDQQHTAVDRPLTLLPRIDLLLQDFDAALALMPSSVKAMLCKGQVLLELGKASVSAVWKQKEAVCSVACGRRAWAGSFWGHAGLPPMSGRLVCDQTLTHSAATMCCCCCHRCCCC